MPQTMKVVMLLSRIAVQVGNPPPCDTQALIEIARKGRLADIRRANDQQRTFKSLDGKLFPHRGDVNLVCLHDGLPRNART